MEWSVVAMILFSAVAVNHLDLIAAIERVIRHSLPVLNCPKCLTFWSVLSYGLLSSVSCGTWMEDAAFVVAAALACAYAAIWLELLMGFIDLLYKKVYEQIYPATDSANDNAAGAEGAMPELRIDFGDSGDPE